MCIDAQCAYLHNAHIREYIVFAHIAGFVVIARFKQSAKKIEVLFYEFINVPRWWKKTTYYDNNPLFCNYDPEAKAQVNIISLNSFHPIYISVFFISVFSVFLSLLFQR